jgi:hypothetical protein
MEADVLRISLAMIMRRTYPVKRAVFKSPVIIDLLARLDATQTAMKTKPQKSISEPVLRVCHLRFRSHEITSMANAAFVILKPRICSEAVESGTVMRYAQKASRGCLTSRQATNNPGMTRIALKPYTGAKIPARKDKTARIKIDRTRILVRYVLSFIELIGESRRRNSFSRYGQKYLDDRFSERMDA